MNFFLMTEKHTFNRFYDLTATSGFIVECAVTLLISYEFQMSVYMLKPAFEGNIKLVFTQILS